MADAKIDYPEMERQSAAQATIGKDADGRPTIVYQTMEPEAPPVPRPAGPLEALYAATTPGSEVEWRKCVEADAELMAQLPDAVEVVRTHGSEELVRLLEGSGLGSHPAVVRFAAKVAASMKRGR